ncbi:MAG TPA: hypothetical protein VK504_13785 [Vicinamibacterales bacterium]|nr:hypothetical protein [Vicinamibacterales bacterium]
MEKPTVNLTPEEARIVALHLAAGFLRYNEDWLQWEDHPHFAEGAWEELNDAVARVCGDLFAQARTLERKWDIDGQLILERAA